jgi:hypothetical protein
MPMPRASRNSTSPSQLAGFLVIVRTDAELRRRGQQRRIRLLQELQRSVGRRRCLWRYRAAGPDAGGLAEAAHRHRSGYPRGACGAVATRIVAMLGWARV